MPGSAVPTVSLQQPGPALGTPSLPSAPTWQEGHPLGLLVTLPPVGGAQGGGQRPQHQCLWWGL